MSLQFRRVLGALCGLAALSALTGGSCKDTVAPEAAQQTVVIQVNNETGIGVSSVRVTAWVVDQDLEPHRRVPIEIGTAPTDGEGIVRFTFVAVEQPYVCGFEVEEIESKNVVAEHVADVSHRLSDDHGRLTIVLPS
ncbi:MAG: hypothetical protein DHS20C21_00790 [Gemmatimonadota bacterium]|nr:MAG: hypothetical protein DHS20C21_00790 [Gemmatimonadota bacterium]